MFCIFFSTTISPLYLKCLRFFQKILLPKWRKDRDIAPGITTKEVRAPLQELREWGARLFFPPTRTMTADEKKKVLSLCIEQGLEAALDSHLYL